MCAVKVSQEEQVCWPNPFHVNRRQRDQMSAARYVT
jgi:hypothetical protein